MKMFAEIVKSGDEYVTRIIIRRGNNYETDLKGFKLKEEAKKHIEDYK